MRMWLLLHLKYSVIGGIFLVVNTLSALSQSVLEALLESSAKLPCDIPLKKSDDPVEFIFWYKDDQVTPLYTVDCRGTLTLKTGRHTITGRERKTKFYLDMTPPYLILSDISEEDEGTYYCRVDFLWSSTEIFSLKLFIIVPPKFLIIRNDARKEIHEIAGPYKIKDNATLTCEARGGHPPPNVTWWKDKKLLDETWEHFDTGTSNTLLITNLQRQDLFSAYRCEARNTDQRGPVIRTVSIDLYLAPLTVNIISKDEALSAGQWVDLTCESKGSRPAANITWWLNYTTSLLADEVQTVTENYTASVLRLLPTPDHHRATLGCRTNNVKLQPFGSLDTSRMLNVTYIPQVTLVAIKEELNRPPRESDYVRLICNVNSNPPIRKLGWLFDDHPLLPEQTSAEMTSDNALIFKRLTRDDMGRYRCYAINDEGKGQSEELELNVTHAPVCLPGQQVTYTAYLNQTVRVRCEVIAEPNEVDFRWEFSNTVRKHYNLVHYSEGTVSFADYFPTSQEDYGTLFCWANNSIGNQRRSCFFTVIAPALPHRCEPNGGEMGTDSQKCKQISEAKRVKIFILS